MYNWTKIMINNAQYISTMHYKTVYSSCDTQCAIDNKVVPLHRGGGSWYMPQV